LAKKLVEKLFYNNPPEPDNRILYPGVGEGPFVDAVSEYCKQKGWPVPDGMAIEIDPTLTTKLDASLNGHPVKFWEQDFLGEAIDLGKFEYIIGNPPYVPIEQFEEGEKADYRERFDSAVQRFDLYLLFFEQALDLLDESGRLIFVTPEKYTYVQTAAPLRETLTDYNVNEIHLLDEDAFTGKITFPTATTIDHKQPNSTRVIRRNGSVDTVELPNDGSSWAESIRYIDGETIDSNLTLGDITKRLGPGVATGADRLFIKNKDELPPKLGDMPTVPTVSGKALNEETLADPDLVMICPYGEGGELRPESELSDFLAWAKEHRERLEDRYCVQNNNKEWYAWHQNPPLQELRQPKILCKDITEEPEFWWDKSEEIVPRNSVYCIISQEHVSEEEMLEYLNGPEAKAWMKANCQRASNGFYRLQTHTLESLPVPEEWSETAKTELA
jgi:hypothetical protein